MEEILKLPNRRMSVTESTKHFHFTISVDHRGVPVEFFVVGRGKTGTELDDEMYEMGVKVSRMMRGEFGEKI